MSKLRNGEVARCQRSECRGRSQEDGKSKEKSLVKPDIVCEYSREPFQAHTEISKRSTILTCLTLLRLGLAFLLL